MQNNKTQGKVNIVQKYIPEIVVVLLYLAAFIYVSIYHEPWFDESEAWQIAKCASLRDILFIVPHYEGHPALWHLILMIPSRLGLPYEISLKTIGGLIMLINIILLEFKAPIKRWIKLIIPFTYFFFYQYGINVRPYGLMLLFFILAACTFKDKDSHPIRFVMCLLGLCLSSAFGILFAGGIALAWTIDILREKSIKETFKGYFKSPRLLALTGLLIAAVLIIIQIVPRSDTYATTKPSGNNVILRLICALFTFIPDSILTENSWSVCETNLQGVTFTPGALIGTSLLGLLMWAVFLLLSKKGLYKYLVLPYTMFAVFAATVYFTAHHIGLVLYVVLFWMWINAQEQGNKSLLAVWWEKIKADDKRAQFVEFCDKNKKSGMMFANFVVTMLLLLSVYWSVQSSILEYKCQYSFGREASKFIKEYKLDELVVMATWEAKDIDGDGIKEVDTNCMYSPVNLYPYFDKEFVANMNYGYTTHRVASAAENRSNMEAWSTMGTPDVLIGYVDVAAITGGEYTPIDYSPVFQLDMKYIWRGAEYIAYDYIFMRNDLLEEYGLERLSGVVGSN